MTDRTPSSSGDDPTDGVESSPLVAADLSAEHRDEIVSAYLDGEATEAEILLVQSTPELLERVEVFRSLAAPIAAVEKVDDAVRTSQIAAAVLAARPPDISIVPAVATPLAGPQPEPEPHPELSPVVPLSTRRRIPPRWLAAAACVLALVVAVPFALNAGGSDSEDAATQANDGAALTASEKLPDPAADAPTADALSEPAGDATPGDDGTDAEASDDATVDGQGVSAAATTEALDDGDAGADADESVVGDSTRTTAAAARLPIPDANYFDTTDFEPGFLTAEEFADEVESRRLPTVDQELDLDDAAIATREALVDLCPDLDLPTDADVVESIVVLQQPVFAVVDESSITVYLSDCSIGAQLP